VTAWIIRASRHGEREQWALENALAGGGFRTVMDEEFLSIRATPSGLPELGSRR
jgi:restriction system protein